MKEEKGNIQMSGVYWNRSCKIMNNIYDIRVTEGNIHEMAFFISWVPYITFFANLTALFIHSIQTVWHTFNTFSCVWDPICRIEFHCVSTLALTASIEPVWKLAFFNESTLFNRVRDICIHSSFIKRLASHTKQRCGRSAVILLNFVHESHPRSTIWGKVVVHIVSLKYLNCHAVY